MIGPFAGSEQGQGLRRVTVLGVDSVDADIVAQWVEDWRAGVAAKLAEDTALARPLSADSSRDVFFMHNRWAFRLRSQVWGERYREIVIRHPDGWWQALRQRFAPGWWLNRFPVREVVHTIAPRIIYPQLKVAMPEEPHVLHLDHHAQRPDDDE